MDPQPAQEVISSLAGVGQSYPGTRTRSLLKQISLLLVPDHKQLSLLDQTIQTPVKETEKH